MGAKYLIGVDFGTTGSRSAVYDFDGNELGSAYSENDIEYPEPGAFVYDGNKAIANLHKTTSEAIGSSGINPNDIAAISFSCARGCYVMYDRDDNFASPLILWPDTRAGVVADRMIQRLYDCGYSEDRLYEDTGFPYSPGWPITRIFWFREAYPEQWEKVTRIGTLQSVVQKAYNLDSSIDVSEDANWFQMLYARSMAPIPEVLDAWGVDPGLLTNFVPAGTPVGRISAGISAKTGLPEGTPIICGAGDQECNLIGTGSTAPGLVSVYAGTCGTVIARIEEYRLDPYKTLNICGAPGGAWEMEGSISGAGGSLKWFRDALCAADMREAAAAGVKDFAFLDRMAENAPAGSNGALFLPFVNGSGTPKFDGYARGCFIGLNKHTGKNELIRAVMEGSTYELRAIMEVLEKQENLPIEAIRFSGGGANSDIWNQIVADIFGYPTASVTTPESSCLGAAIIAAVGIGMYSDVKEGALKMVKVRRSWEPIPGNVERYNEQYAIHQGCYKALSDSGMFKRISERESVLISKISS